MGRPTTVRAARFYFESQTPKQPLFVSGCFGLDLKILKLTF